MQSTEYNTLPEKIQSRSPFSFCASDSLWHNSQPMTGKIFSLFLLLTLLLSACQLNAGESVLSFLSPPTETPTPTVTATPTPTSTPTNTPSPTPSPTPTNTPTPTATPIPSDRLAAGLRAYTNGDYETARQQFGALLSDPGADPGEQRLALHWRGRSEVEAGDSAAAINSLFLFLEQYPGDPLARSAQFNLAVAYEQAGQFEAAITAYRGAIIPDDPINVYIYERLGDVALQAGQYDRAVEAYQNGLEATSDVGFQVHLRESIAAVEMARDNPAGAIAQYEAILAVAEIESYRAKILRLAGEAHLAAEETAAAHERYLEAVNSYPEAYDSYLALVELVEAGVAVDEFQRGLVDYHAAAYQPAVDAFERYLATPLTSPVTLTPTVPLTGATTVTDTTRSPEEPVAPPRTAQALWYMGRSWQWLGQYNNAIATFQRLIDEYPASENWGQAHLEIGKSQSWQDRITAAKATFRTFAAANPDHPLAPEALWRAARLDLDGDLLAEAYTNLRALTEQYPTSDYATEGLYWAGQAAYLNEDYEAAIETWGQLMEDYPDSELFSFGAYWQARALMDTGQNEAAEAVLAQVTDRSDEYYGLRARDLLTGSPPQSVPLVLPTAAQSAQEQAEAEAWLQSWVGQVDQANLATLSERVRADVDFQKGAALLALGLRAEALAEFEKVKDSWWDDPLAMYQLALYFGEQHMGRLSILAAARLVFLSPAEIPEDAPLFIQRLFYPILFDDLIFSETEKTDQDPALILSIMRQESLFEQSAVSIAGARGLMQVMPATGEYVAEQSDFGPFETNQLWLPYVSIKFGTWYIDQQLDIFDGNQFAALAAYNAGPGNVAEWIKISDDLDIFVESIPFWESRLYIRKIYINLAAYRRIYGLSSADTSVPD